MKRITVVVPLAVAVCILIGLLIERGRSPAELPSFTPARAPAFSALEPPSGTASLHGRVVDPAGQPVPDASVYVRAEDVPHWTFSDESGAFRLDGLGTEPTTAAVLAWGFPPTEFEVQAQDEGEAVTLTLPPRSDVIPGLPNVERADLVGRVLDPLAADPLSLARSYEVVLLPADPPHEIQGPVAVRALTDGAGRFEFEQLAVGRYRTLVLPAWAQGGTWPDLVGGTGPVLDHTLGAEPLELPLAAGSLAGRLRDPSDLPIEGALVLLTRAEDSGRVWPPLLTDAEGGFRLDDLPAGDFLLDLRAGQGVLTGTPVRIEAGRHLELPLTTLRIREDREGNE